MTSTLAGNLGIELPDIRCGTGRALLRSGPSHFARRCVYGGWMRVKVSPDLRFTLGTDQTAASSLQQSCKGGRPRLPLRDVVTGIVYVLRTGCQWKAMPVQFGLGSAIDAYFQEWVQRGIFEKLWQRALEEYDELKGIDWRWQSLDGAMTKGATGRGKKPGKTRPIAASWASSDLC